MKLIKLRLLLLIGILILWTIPFKGHSQETTLSQTITIKFENEILKTAIKRIEKETGIAFAYSNLNDLNKKISGEFTKQPLSNVLTNLFKGTNISFKEIAGKITLFENAQPEKKKVVRATIHGYISDAESGERLINASIYNPDTYVGTISNNFGFYSYSALTGNLTLLVSYMGYQTQTFIINLERDTTLNISLRGKTDELEEITITGAKIDKIEESQMSMIDMPIQKLTKVPSILGEADILKVIQLLPGVQAGTEGTSGIYVRGGGPDQNLYLLDGVPVYNPSHLLGIFSVFNPDALKSVKLYKGAFPARFGGRLSSVVDVSMKDGNMKELHGDFAIGLLTSKIMLEGPIKKDQTSFMLSARRSYADILAKPVFMITNKKNNQDLNFSAYFHDFNLKVNHIFSDRSRLYLSGYYGKDQGNYSETMYNAWSYTDGYDNATQESITRFGMGWGNAIASVRWNYMLSPKLFSNTTATYSKYIFDTEFHDIINDLVDKTSSENAYIYHSGIRDYSVKIDFDYYPACKHAIKFGAQYMNHRFTPGVTTVMDANLFGDSTSLKTVYGNKTIDGNEFDAFVEDDIKVSSKLSINAGIHLSAYAVEDTTYLHPQPRLSFRYKMNDDWSVKASYSRMVQHVHLLYNSG
ncbi:MAG: TonB-dependent receptor, partial [Prolixibacteraceae bacterium]|nr:TonB-dependent receptor [Prolixibacteraceae bacterium]